MAVSIRQAKPVSDGELMELSRLNPGYRFERRREGCLIVTPSGSESGRRGAEVAGQLREWTRAGEPGIVFDSSAGFRLGDGSVLAPDASWVRRERWESLTGEEREGFAPLCPDAVFEIRSRTDDLVDTRAKMRDYLDNGAKLAVLIDPYGRFVEVYRPGRAPEHSAAVEAIALDPELPGFALDTTALW